MRIVCPTCSATYEVREDLLVPGRSVRCARCGEQWPPLPAAPPAEPEPEQIEDSVLPPQEPAYYPQPRLTAMERLASHPAPLPPASPWLHAAWAASLILLVVIVAGLFVWRADLMHAWPPIIRLYDVIGLGPPPAAH